MAQIHKPNIQLLYNDARLAALFDTLDELHSAASEGQLQKITGLNSVELVGWLREFVYTAQETIAELEGDDGNPPNLRRVK
jgi:hypothetical protein